MCLSLVTSRAELPKARGTGWKVFRVDRNGALYSEVYSTSRSRQPGRKYRATCLRRPRYCIGFHIFTRKKDAREWDKDHGHSCSVRKVKSEHRLATGNQRGCNTWLLSMIVAKYMTILPEKNDK